jgi:2'-5' RNA ligase
MPDGRPREELAAVIHRLAARLGTEAFAPHVTLLPGLVTPEAEVVDGARDLAAELGPMVLEPTEVDGLDEHFRCLFYRIGGTPALRQARAAAALRFGGDPEAPFEPHLSLVYGRLDEPSRTDLKRELSVLAPSRFEARRLHVWRTEGRVGEWREVATLDLGARPDD